MFNFNVYLAALGLSTSQIVGIGPQNAYVLRQGIGRSHILPIVLICIVADVLLISAGVLGMGQVIAGIPGFIRVVTWLGAAFLLWLGIKSFRAAWSAGGMQLEGSVERDRQRAIRTILVVTLLNPYVWLDTVILIGSVASVYGSHAAPSFILGSITASICWFAGIGFFAGKLAPWFKKPGSWRALDIIIGLVMVFTSSMLVWNYGLNH
ncbi:LysE/ArgO family amino acid transporter [uncultured Aquitalea sp.]|uniref:LysE/ArgO family amino acid transporter n=1 Tax=uncultured Aquitalea sp. TaxID=540272 RepID=UPI0025F6E2A8|nr:LysE/ArgO family amino acid transporter [uncultured Aquitalea sp.]